MHAAMRLFPKKCAVGQEEGNVTSGRKEGKRSERFASRAGDG